MHALSALSQCHAGRSRGGPDFGGTDAGRRAAGNRRGHRRQAVRRTGRPYAGPGPGGRGTRPQQGVRHQRGEAFQVRAARQAPAAQEPNAYEIERCRWWNDLERAIVKPELVVALGATAARSLLGRTVSITSVRDRKSTRLNSSHEWISYAV